MNAINTLEVSALQLSQVDVLGSLLAQISELTKEADAIKDGLKDAATAGGDKVVEGALFKATAIEANRSVVDYKKLCADLGITADVLAQYTKTTAVFSIKVTAR
jgi:hypothetical protein